MGMPPACRGMADTENGADPDMSDLLGELRDLEATVDDPDERELVRDTIDLAHDVATPRVFGRVIHGYDRADIAETALGSFLFGIPMAVESGTLEVGAALADSPVALGATILGTIGLVYGVIYVAEIQEVRVADPLLGVIPRRLLGAVVIPLVIATLLMTAWGRVSWGTPTVAFSQVVAAFVPMTLGGALTDIVPGS